MSSHTILQDADRFLSPRSKNYYSAVSSIRRDFRVFEERVGFFSYYNSHYIDFWEIRERLPPSDDIIAHVGDIYLDTSTNPVGVYQNTSTGCGPTRNRSA